MSNENTALKDRYHSFEEFWPFYLSQHKNAVCRNLHLFGTSLGILWLIYCVATTQYPMIFFSLILGYGFSWVGHFFFEHNRPATFIYPRWSFMGDFRMMKLFYTGHLKAELAKHRL